MTWAVNKEEVILIRIAIAKGQIPTVLIKENVL